MYSVCAHHGEGGTGEHEVDHTQRETLADPARWMVCSVLVPRELLGLMLYGDLDLSRLAGAPAACNSV